MPELPEVEITRRGIEPHISQQIITKIIIRDPRLRWPVSQDLKKNLPGHKVQKVSRRGKYLLLTMSHGTLIMHLGMSGSLRILPMLVPSQKHDHIDIQFANQQCLRLTDPRRFGAVIFVTGDPQAHKLLNKLGPEPLSKNFTGAYLFQQSRHRKVPIKSFIMNSNVVVGVGNIYATEALFLANIHPKKSAGKISKLEYDKLVAAIKKTLQAAIRQGGTTLRNFSQSDGKPGYFKVHLKVYGRAGLPCVVCKTELKEIRLGQRSTVFCPRCQR